ncbi:CIC11C00000000042 [Sungouiella intermedia]|uniref:CIC11C00000000042 n=1 Tax=Sungouiella intermedia TaxID=45354 RepID=A0A1L0E155_9ASCO|nr:CIC11C00000000042 [[Candida] intermedia]
MFQLPPPSLFSSLSTPKKVEVLDHLFEPCLTLAEVILARVNGTYSTYGDFIEACRSVLLQFLTEEDIPGNSAKIDKIVSAHPRLGPSKDKLSSHSTSEQKSLAGSEEEARKLTELNDLYEETFPGLRYVVFVNGRSREVIMANMKARIERNDVQKEKAEAFNAMCDIALDRASKLGARL